MTEHPKITALLPMKAHSARVKSKNFRLIAGKPLFQWILDALLAAYLGALNAGTADSLFTVNEMHTRFYTVDGAPINHDPDNLIRTQDLPAYMEENSVCYLFTPASFASTNARIGRKPLLFPTPKLQSVDIDEVSDWFIAESLLTRIAAGEKLPEEA